MIIACIIASKIFDRQVSIAIIAQLFPGFSVVKDQKTYFSYYSNMYEACVITRHLLLCPRGNANTSHLLPEVTTTCTRLNDRGQESQIVDYCENRDHPRNLLSLSIDSPSPLTAPNFGSYSENSKSSEITLCAI